jgi:hypothetical protein
MLAAAAASKGLIVRRRAVAFAAFLTAAAASKGLVVR